MLLLLAFTLMILLEFWILVLMFSRELEGRGFTVYPGVLMWRTKRGLRFIDRGAKASKGGWLAFGTAGVAIGLCLMVLIFVGLTLNAVLTLAQPVEALAGVRLALPGMIPGLSILSWLIAVLSVLLVHEFAHGFLLRAQGLQTKTVGGMLVGVIPGAFVEPNEKELMEAPVSKRLRVFGAGSLANILLAFLCLGILLLILTPKPGVYVYGVVRGYPAENAGLATGMRIYAIDNVFMHTYDDYRDFVENTKPGQTISISADNRDFRITLAKHPDNEERGYLGMSLISAPPRPAFANPFFSMEVMMWELTGHPVFHPYVYDAYLPWGVVDVVRWMFVLNLGIGLFNLLPAVPLDGGYMIQGVIERVKSKRVARRVMRMLSYFVLALIIVNFVPFFM